MKHMLCLSVLVAVSLVRTVYAADWHVAPGGTNGSAGSAAEPLETIEHAISRSSSGDRILLQRNGRYQALDVDLGSGRTIGAYGEGAAPVVSGSHEVTLDGTWSQNSDVKTAAVAGRVLACYVNGRFVPLARYPNQGFLRIDNDDSPDQIVDAELADRAGVTAGRWTGAQVRWRRWSWWWETRPIVAHSSVDTLDLGPEGRFQDPFSDAGSGYFIDNDLDELDAPGEWFWGDGTLYLYPPSDANPQSMLVEVVTSEASGLKTSGTDIEDLWIEHYVGNAVEINRSASVERCTFSEVEVDAIRYTWNGQPFTIRHNVFRDVRNTAISGWADAAGPAGSLIERNLFLRIGMQRGYGGSGSWHAAGVILGQANSAAVRLNRFVDTGYAGIILGSDGQTVERNVFVRTMGTLNDGAAVYTNCNASTIRENIILDTIGDLETSHPWWPLGHGIWPEFLEDFRDSVIAHNTVVSCNGNGIFLPNNFTCTVSDNICVDNRRGGLDLSGDGGDNQDHSISGNLLASVAPDRRINRPENLSRWWLPPYEEPVPVALSYEPGIDYGAMSQTTFVASPNQASPFRPEGQNTLDAWLAAEPSWAENGGSSLVRGHAVVLFNDTEATTDMAVPAGTWTLPDGTAAPGRLTLQPFRGAVIISSGPVAADPPYYAASGINWRAEIPTNTYLGSTTPVPDAGSLDSATTVADTLVSADTRVADTATADTATADTATTDTVVAADGVLVRDSAAVDGSADASAGQRKQSKEPQDLGQGCACAVANNPTPALLLGLFLFRIVGRRYP